MKTRNEARYFRSAPPWEPLAAWVIERRAELAVAALCVWMFLFRLGTMPLTSPNEGLYGEVAREMLQRHDWVVPHIDGVVYFEKPPALYWLAALSMRLFGVDAFAARLPSALAGVATTWLVFWLGRRLYGKTAGTVSAMVLATSLGSVIMARQVMFDTLLTCWMTAALAAFWLADGEGGATVLIAYAALGLAVLTKGFIGLLPLGIVLAYAGLTRDWGRLKRMASAAGVLLFLVIATPWHVAAAHSYGQFVWFYFVNEHVLRFLGHRHPADFHVDPIYTPLTAPLVLLFPWAGLVPPALSQALASREGRAPLSRDALFLCCWIAVPVLFFTAARTRTLYYMLPVAPPIALLIGRFWSDVSRGVLSRALQACLRASLLLFLVFVSGAWVWCGLNASLDRDRGQVLAFAFIATCPLVIGAGAALVASRRKPQAVFACLGASAVLTWTVGLYAFGVWQTLSWGPVMARAIERAQTSERPLVAVDGRLENFSSLIFYLPRRLEPILMVGGREGGDLEFGSRYPSVSALFISGDALGRLAAGHDLFFVTGERPRRLPPPVFAPICHFGEHILWRSRPRAPRARISTSLANRRCPTRC